MSNLDQSNMKKKEHCANQQECMQMLQLILDGEATTDQKEHFLRHHLDECMPCYKNYHLEIKLRELLKTNCTGGCPSELAESIKSQINNSR
jgi:anti-sigma factor (TIGR02949 family)